MKTIWVIDINSCREFFSKSVLNSQDIYLVILDRHSSPAEYRIPGRSNVQLARVSCDSYKNLMAVYLGYLLEKRGTSVAYKVVSDDAFYNGVVIEYLIRGYVISRVGRDSFPSEGGRKSKGLSQYLSRRYNASDFYKMYIDNLEMVK